MAQVFVVVAAGSVIGFIVRDLGDGEIAGWIIQVSVKDTSQKVQMLTKPFL